ncbi:Glycosyltransferase 2-like domain-containing protein [Plasmodiophora brassicae]|uniref:Uncharacterized protein n=1 Tax=Plasmodiophora brassicae TaxID=37360 RepID=A0A0G4IMB3_PLABS|nr:hypothetical protein PBRA_004908 [Plasmodiophora brassicae]SPQ99171.1 unnamed protein product [Plasmodiophora brassicae]
MERISLLSHRVVVSDDDSDGADGVGPATTNRPALTVWDRVPPGRSLWTLVLAVTAIVSVGAIACALTVAVHHPHSIVNPAGLVEERRAQHDDAVGKATRYFLDERRPRPVLAQAHPEVTLVAMTVRRAVPYIQVWMWSLLTRHDPDTLRRTSIVVINHGGEDNAASVAPFRADGIEVVSIDDYDRSQWLSMQYVGFVHALQACRMKSSTWCVVCEEDGLWARDSIDVFLRLAEQVPATSDTMVKLFRPTTFDGWRTDRLWQLAFELGLLPVAIAVLLTSCVVALMVVLTKRRAVPHRGLVRRRIRLSVLVLMALIWIDVIVCCLILGRQNVVDLVTWDRSPGLEPCPFPLSNIAIAFRGAAGIRALERHLSALLSKSGDLQQIDLEVYAWAERNDWAILQTRPSLVQHIGAFSSNRHKNQGDFAQMLQDHRYRDDAPATASPYYTIGRARPSPMAFVRPMGT